MEVVRNRKWQGPIWSFHVCVSVTVCIVCWHYTVAETPQQMGGEERGGSGSTLLGQLTSLLPPTPIISLGIWFQRLTNLPNPHLPLAQTPSLQILPYDADVHTRMFPPSSVACIFSISVWLCFIVVSIIMKHLVLPWIVWCQEGHFYFVNQEFCPQQIPVIDPFVNPWSSFKASFLRMTWNGL